MSNLQLENGCRLSSYGYLMRYKPGHPHAHSNGYAFDHILIVERVLGKSLPEKAEIHHVNENKIDNSNANLVLCEDNAYHTLLHQRKRAYLACGHAHWRKCLFCKKYDDPENLYIDSRNAPYHRECMNKNRREIREKRNAQYPKDPHYRRGDKNGNSKLKNGEVYLIKRLLNSGKFPQNFIAKMFKRPSVTINHINTGKTWSHIVYPAG